MNFAREVESMLHGRPHVGAVLHFEGVAVPELAVRLRRVLDGNGLVHEDALEEANGTPVFNVLVPIAVGKGMELWLSASEKQDVGCKLELRLFHAIEDSAQADEYLADFRDRVTA